MTGGNFNPTGKNGRVTLDPKHKILADRFLATGKKQQSAIDAGYAKNGAHVTASRILKRPDVQEYLRVTSERLLKKEEKAEEDSLQARVLKELEAMSFANIEDFISINSDGEPEVNFSKATREQLKAITSVASKRRTTRTRSGDVVEEKESKFSMADKYRGLELIMKHTGMLKPDEHKVTIDVADRLLLARQRMQRIEDQSDD